jgi:acetolactate synthase I/II/III large subunit
MTLIKYSDLFCKWLQKMGYTHCFCLAGGHAMHLNESASNYFTFIPVVNEVAAGIAAEYFNETETDKKAFVLVTAGPGLTNVMTAIAGVFLESRELLIIGGQAKTADLAQGGLRQNGIQEINGSAIVKPITKEAISLRKTIGYQELEYYVNQSKTARKGPVFIEVPIDIQASQVNEEELTNLSFDKNITPITKTTDKEISDIALMLKNAKRPVILLGAGISRKNIAQIYKLLENKSVPIMLTWNAADRVGSEHPLYFGRPNTWGMRYSNILLQQSDLLIAIGTRLSMQQTGFNWQNFVPLGKVVHVDCDKAELDKTNPKIDVAIHAEANHFLLNLLQQDTGSHTDWLDFCNEVKASLPLVEENHTGDNFVSPHNFHQTISSLCQNDDVIIPCSSGSAFTIAMQVFAQKKGQIMITNKGLASMGYGLSGAIGAAISMQPRRTILFEGDGGFAQNIQEIGTAAINNLNLKIFIFDDNGYASIRMTQKNYFNGKYVGCDIKTGVGLPDWKKLFAAYNVPCLSLDKDFANNGEFLSLFNNHSIAAFIVPIDPEQSYFPKITSRVTENGSMESNPIHLMTPDLEEQVMNKVGKYFKG